MEVELHVDRLIKQPGLASILTGYETTTKTA